MTHMDTEDRKKTAEGFDAEEIDGNTGTTDLLAVDNNKHNISEIRNEVLDIGDDIIHSARFRKAGRVQHHIKFTVAQHSMEVAMYALLISRWLKNRGVRISEEDTVRAALLHDIGMTEDAVHDSPSYKKAFLHPREGHRIARDEFHLNKVQLNAIHRHMFPIGIVPPKHVMGWVITFADNMSSFNEGLAILKARARRIRKRQHGK